MQGRQITLTRFIAAAPEAVWRCWTDPTILPNWFGPQGFSCKTKDIDLTAGGQWRFDMLGPDGTIYANRHRYHIMERPNHIAFLLDADDDASAPFQVEVTLDPEQAGTRITQVMTFPTAQMREGALAYGADRLGQTTLDKLSRAASEL